MKKKRKNVIDNNHTYDPMKQIEKEGDFGRNMTKSTKKETKILTFGKIMFSIIFFIIPAAIITYVFIYDGITNKDDRVYLLLVVFPLLYLIVGFKILYSALIGLKSKKG